ncbi:MAG: hypothetical protein HZB53_16325 [Chloroflexi bacterium]|nr:hypothetical protein [Chloroflexota bacterium]
MPRLTRLCMRAALVYLGLGFTFGALMLADKGVPFAPWLLQLLPLHIEVLLFGWTVQMVMGVAFWIMPKFGRGTSRGRERFAWAAFFLLNAGVWLAGAGELSGLPAAVTLAGRLCEAGAAACFVFHAWPRVKPMLDGR